MKTYRESFKIETHMIESIADAGRTERHYTESYVDTDDLCAAIKLWGNVTILLPNESRVVVDEKYTVIELALKIAVAT